LLEALELLPFQSYGLSPSGKHDLSFRKLIRA
jgi:hypothetical protein